jgi:hypothetical protein
MSNDPSQDKTSREEIPSVTQERVTSEELNQALARIEARKAEEARRTAGTIPLGQAVEELGLDATPAEIFAEVQAQRQSTGITSDGAPVVPSVWPPPPGPQHSAVLPGSAALTHCPACARKLLTQASVLCNWCGAKISDPQYQEQAALSRQALDQQERKQVEEVVLEETRYGIYGRLKRRAKQNTGNRNPLG